MKRSFVRDAGSAWPGTKLRFILRSSAAARLAVGVALLASTWLLVLPAVSRQTPLRDTIERNQSHGVNANAMYYTELEGVRFLDLWRAARNLPGHP